MAMSRIQATHINGLCGRIFGRRLPARVVELAPRWPTAIRELGAGTTRAEMVERHGANGVLSMGLFWENAPEPCRNESKGVT
jgi:hypothetical protein